jgi:hypothetical protein
MKLRDLLFTGMDIPNETRKVLAKFTVTDGMTENELKAYEMGVENTLRATRALLEIDQLVFHVSGYDVIEEFDLDELIEIVEEKEGY